MSDMYLYFDDSNNINYWDLNREYFIENKLTVTIIGRLNGMTTLYKK